MGYERTSRQMVEPFDKANIFSFTASWPVLKAWSKGQSGQGVLRPK
jgi:hypothetical protein